MDLDLDGKVFIVSGGTSGLGAAVAAGLVGEGARVVVCSRSSRRVSEAVSTLGERAVGLAADLLVATTPSRLIERARRSFGRLDGAFVSHGGPDPGPATDLDDARLRRAMESAVVAPIALIREIVRELPSGGAVVALTSSTGVEPMVGMAASNVARAALHGYVKTIATEVATRGVRVNVLIPGPFATARLQQLAAEGTAEQRGGRHGTPMDRDGNPTELVAAACLLLSSRSSFVTGAAWTVDGGRRRTL